jgi:catalase
VPKPAVEKGKIDKSPALSIEYMKKDAKKDAIPTRLVGVLVADGVDVEDLSATRSAIEKAGGQVVLIAKRLGTVKGSDGQPVMVDKSSLTTASVEYDAVFVPGGAASVAVLKKDADAMHFIQEAYRHCKAIGVTREASELLEAGGISLSAPGIVADAKGAKHHHFTAKFIEAIAEHRHWMRLDRNNVPA